MECHFHNASDASLQQSHMIRTLQEQLRLCTEQSKILIRETVAKNQQIQELEAAADRDSLTGLYNRRGAALELRRILGGFERQDYSVAGRVLHQLSVLVMDLNNFKAVNDRFGHAAGDQVLLIVSAYLQKAFRAEDIIIRNGGDEFVVYLINATQAGAAQRAERLAALLREDERLRFDDNIQVSISVGISHGSFFSSRGGLHIINDLEQLCDMAMCRAKNDSRESSGINIAPVIVFSDTAFGNL